MYCQNCGSENTDSARFCNNCGNELFVTRKPVKNTIVFNHGSKEQKNKIDQKNKIIYGLLAVLILMIVLPVFVSNLSKEVPKQQIEAFINDEYNNYRIQKIKHSYDADVHIDTILVKIVYEDTYANIYRDVTLRYLYTSSDDLWTLENEDDELTDIEWDKQIFKTWSGEGYTFTLHSIDTSDIHNMKVVCSYSFEGVNKSMWGDAYNTNYIISGYEETLEIVDILGYIVMSKTDAYGVEHYFSVFVDTSSGVKVKM